MTSIPRVEYQYSYMIGNIDVQAKPDSWLP